MVTCYNHYYSSHEGGGEAVAMLDEPPQED